MTVGLEMDYLGNYRHGGMTNIPTHELTDVVSDPPLLKRIILVFLASSILCHYMVIGRPLFWTIM